jgi:ABC-type branched-subunit amino acid transport system permease subunit
MAVGLLNTLVVVLGLAWLLGRTGAANLGSALAVSLGAWFAFSFTTQALEYLYMGMSLPFVAINMGYLLASFLIAGAALSLVKIGARSRAAVAA